MRQAFDMSAGSSQELHHLVDSVAGHFPDGNMGGSVQHHGCRPSQWWTCVAGVWLPWYEPQPCLHFAELL